MALVSASPVYEQNGVSYPYTKMNFFVSIANTASGAAFTEITGIDANVDVIEFRQGNSGSLAPIKIPGLVKHGNITMKFGLTKSADFRQWIRDCTDEQRKAIPRADIIVELIDTIEKAPEQAVTGTSATTNQWVLKNAWVAKYSGTDLNAQQSEAAIESIEVAYEEMETIPLPA
jgi:phage tail-like protein